MTYVYGANFIRPENAKFVCVERNKLNPIEGASFVSIAYWEIAGEIIGVVY